MSSAAIQTARGRWSKGQSGNPAGRPVGRLNRIHQVLRDLMVIDAERVVKAVIEAAVNGDMVAARIVLDRLYPRRMRAMDGFEMPAIANATDACAAMAAVVNAAIAGTITTSEAAELSAVIEVYRRMIETADLLGRLERLESIAANKS